MNLANRLKPILLSTLITLSLPMAAHADDKGGEGKHCERHAMHHKGEKFGHMGIPPHLADLNLSQDQQDKVFAIFYPQIPKIREIHKQEKQLKDELRAVSQSDRFDETKARLIADKLAVLEREQALNRAKTEQQIYSVLTPEQRKILQEIKDNAEKHGFMHPARLRGHQHGNRHTSG